MGAVLGAGTAAFFFAVALVVFGLGGGDRIAVAAVLVGLVALALAVLAHVAPRPPRDPDLRS